MNDILWPKVVALLTVPPGIIIVIGILGLFLTIWRRWIGSIVMGFALLALFVLSVPVVGKRLLGQLEAPYRSDIVGAGKPMPSNIQAIVILGGGRYSEAPE